MQSDVKSEMRHCSSPLELFRGRMYRKAILIASGLKVTQIMTGAVTVSQYLALIMKESQINLKLSTILITFGAVRFFVSIMPAILVDRVGRRPLLIYSYFGTSISLFIVGLYFFFLNVIQVDRPSISPYGFVTFSGIIVANIISTIGYYSIVTIIPGEIFPLNIKSVAMTCLSIFGGILSFIIARSYQALVDVIGLCGVFWIFSAVALIGAMFSLLFVPETKGKSLKEIQERLQGELYKLDSGKDGNGQTIALCENTDKV